MLLDKNNLHDITSYLRDKQLIDVDETVISAEKPGEGNMNYVLRINLQERALIMKQARPYVEKYPTIAAPEERVIIEGEFYKQVKPHEALRTAMPSIFNVDEENHILVLEDVGDSKDYTFLYQQQNQLSEEEAQSLATFLSVLHTDCKAGEPSELMVNRKLRALNHEHIFIYPLMEENGFNLDQVQPGLQELAMKYKTNDKLKKKATELGEVYLKDGSTLLHGDYYPGSWLKTSAGVKVIDPEFCFYGAAEFDLGVMSAHLIMAQQDDAVLQTVTTSYIKPDGFSEELLNQFTGIEIIRRIIGLAQLPLTLTLPEKKQQLEMALGLLNI